MSEETKKNQANDPNDTSDSQDNNQTNVQVNNQDGGDDKPGVTEMKYASYDDFQKLDMRVGTIRHVEPVEGTDKLLRCLVDFGTEIATQTYTDDNGNAYPVRQIVSGIREYLDDPQDLVGKSVLYVVNLEPRMIKGIESQGMLMAIGDDNEPLVFMVPSKDITPGSRIR